jgi:hypothetical protein
MRNTTHSSKRRSPRSRHSSASLPPRQLRSLLNLEALEERTLLSVYSFDYSNGFNGNGLALNGAATENGPVVQLGGSTGAASSAFYATAVPVNNFASDFRVQTTSQSAGGITFTIQNDPQGGAALGQGTGFGYQGLAANSVAIALTTQNTTGLLEAGSGVLLAPGTITLNPTQVNFQAGDVLDIHVAYDGTNLTIRELDEKTQQSSTQQYAVNLPALVGGNNAYIGFTSGGSATQVLGWNYTPVNAPPSIGVNLGEAQLDYSGTLLFADAMKTARAFSGPLNAAGWPLQNSQVLVTDPPGGVWDGTYHLIFQGEAQITPYACSFQVVNQQYDPQTNTTSAYLLVQGQRQIGINFTNTQHDASAALDTGITNVELMRPTAPGSSVSYDPSVVFTTQAESLISQFSTVRYMDFLATNGNQQVNWSDRVLPGYATQNVLPPGAGWEGIGGSWEYIAALANATHTDAWINIPIGASPDYILKVAQLFAYGSDGVNPYTGPVANPVYKPLDPGLKLYIEYSNEVWNPFFTQYATNHALAVAAAAQPNSPLRYDGTTNPVAIDEREVAQKTVDISNTFRSVFGDSEMMSRIRPVLEWQYGGGWYGQEHMLSFLNNYYDNGDGLTHVSNPHAVSYYVWGGGGGWYSSVQNPSGLGAVSIPDNSFEGVPVNRVQADPTSGAWNFTGTAGIVNNNDNVLLSLGKRAVADSTASGSNPNFATDSSPSTAWVAADKAAGHSLTIDLGSSFYNAYSTVTFQTPGVYQYTIAVSPDGVNWTQVVDEGKNGRFGASITDSFTSVVQSRYVRITFTGMPPGMTANVANFQVFGNTFGNPATPNGHQAAYIQGTGSFSTQVTIPTSGVYDVSFLTAAIGGEQFTVSLTGANGVSMPLAADFWNGVFDANGRSNYVHGHNGWMADNVEHSKAIQLQAGTYTLTITGKGQGKAFFDNVQMGSIDAMYSSGLTLPGSTKNLPGTMDSVQRDSALAAAYGLHDTGYEGGFQIGSDHASDLQKQANLDPRAQAAEVSAVTRFFQDGGDLALVFNLSGYSAYGLASPNILATNTPKLLGLAAVQQAPQPAPTYGIAVSPTQATSLPVNVDSRGVLFPSWVSGVANTWTLTAPSDGAYSVTVTTNNKRDLGDAQAAVYLNGTFLGLVSENADQGVSLDSCYLHTGTNALRIVSVGSSAATNRWRPTSLTLTPTSPTSTPDPLPVTPGSGVPNPGSGVPSPTIPTPPVPTPAPAKPHWLPLVTITGNSIVPSIAGPAGATFSFDLIHTPPKAPAPVIVGNGGLSDAVNFTFGQAGWYIFRTTITDPTEGGTSTTALFTVHVVPTLTGFSVTPGSSTVPDRSRTQFAITGAVDQFGRSMATPKVRWSLGAGSVGTILSDGTYQAPAFGGGTATVVASADGITASASVTVPA